MPLHRLALRLIGKPDRWPSTLELPYPALRLQSRWRVPVGGCSSELVAPGDDGRGAAPTRNASRRSPKLNSQRTSDASRGPPCCCMVRMTRSCPSTTLRDCRLSSFATNTEGPGYPHGMCATHADVIDPDLLAFIGGSYDAGRRRPSCRRPL